MTGDARNFDSEAARRIAKATRHVEGLQTKADPVPSRRDHSLVNAPIRPVVVRENDPMSTNDTILVSMVARGADGQTILSASAHPVKCWYEFEARHYAAFAQPSGDSVMAETQILAIFRVDGGWRLWPGPMRWVFPYSDDHFLFDDCAPRRATP
jgi:hypothetical protein